MGEMIIFDDKHVKGKGLNTAALPVEEKVKDYFFREDFARFPLLKDIAPFAQERATLLYPGSGADVLSPLLYLDALFPNLKNATLIFVDPMDSLGAIKTILDDVGVYFKENRRRTLWKKYKTNAISFYWNHTLIELKFVPEDIFQYIHTSPSFDIYFERAFRIMKGHHEGYEAAVVEKLTADGIIISDSGFGSIDLKRIDVPQELSPYKEMVIGIKK